MGREGGIGGGVVVEIEQIINRWRAEGIQLQTGAADERIAILERLTSFTFSSSFKKFYGLVDGFANNDWTSGMFYIWPLENISKEWTISWDKEFIPFCDYLINSHQIGFSKVKPGLFKRYGIDAEPEEPVCLEFYEVLNLISNDAPEVN